MQSEKRGEHNGYQKCSYEMWCCISWGSGKICYEVRKEANITVIKSVLMRCDVVLVEEVERFDVKCEKWWT
jgi:hypothetical protein